MNNFYDNTKKTYDKWFLNNIEKLRDNKFSLIDKTKIDDFSLDMERGLNIISYLPEVINDKIDCFIESKLANFIDYSFILPREGRHITILDIIPHNASYSLDQLRQISNGLKVELETKRHIFDKNIRIILNGIFASPDGITVQGFVVNDQLSILRNNLRYELEATGYLLEKSKYINQTAHIAILKFTKSLDGKQLVEIVKQFREFDLGDFEIDNYCLNISSRFDKKETIEKILLI
jgi:hypothetical protein